MLEFSATMATFTAPTFTAPDGTALGYRVTGSGDPLLVIPGGPMRSGEYLGDLGGLAAHRTLHVLDLRGSGASGSVADPASWRCDRQVPDLEAFRAHLGLDRADVLGHSAGASLAILHAVAHPDRVASLTLVAPSLLSVGIVPNLQCLREALVARDGLPAVPAAVEKAVEKVAAGTSTEADWAELTPLYYGRWDENARAHAQASERQRNAEAARAYYAEGVFDPEATRRGLAEVTAPVLLLAGELDPAPRPAMAAEAAALFPEAQAAVLPGAAHFPWLDDPAAFVRVAGEFLR